MTLAIDKVSGAVVGQVVLPNRDEWFHMRHTLCLLTRDGYRNVDAASVRLERVEDN